MATSLHHGSDYCIVYISYRKPQLVSILEQTQHWPNRCWNEDIFRRKVKGIKLSSWAHRMGSVTPNTLVYLLFVWVICLGWCESCQSNSKHPSLHSLKKQEVVIPLQSFSVLFSWHIFNSFHIFPRLLRIPVQCFLLISISIYSYLSIWQNK